MGSERPASRARRMADAVLSVDETLAALNATVEHMHATLSLSLIHISEPT